MKARSALLLACATLAASCGEPPLSHEECQAMIHRQLDIMDAPAQVNSQAIEQFMARCTTGEDYDRDDYVCFSQAKTIDDINACEN